MQVMAKSNTWRIDEGISEAWSTTAKSTKKGPLKLQKTYVKKKKKRNLPDSCSARNAGLHLMICYDKDREILMSRNQFTTL